MADRSRIEKICKTLAAEHRRLMDLVERIRQQPEGPRLVRRVAQLRELLIVHFAREQLDNGLYDTLDGMLTGRDDELRGLIDDHRAILDSVNRLLERMGKADAGEPGDSAPDLAALLEMIARHERREQAFVTGVLETR